MLEGKTQLRSGSLGPVLYRILGEERVLLVFRQFLDGPVKRRISDLNEIETAEVEESCHTRQNARIRSDGLNPRRLILLSKAPAEHAIHDDGHFLQALKLSQVAENEICSVDAADFGVAVVHRNVP